MRSPLAEYATALRSAQPLSVRTSDGRVIGLDVARWLGPVDAVDETVLARCRAPVLDVGCGPGRFVAELNARGKPALGVDVAAAAVLLTRRRGAPAVLRDAFGVLPGEGRWPTVLLVDGNIGIGADPVRLLARMRALLAARGHLVIEVDPDAGRDEIVEVRFVRDGRPVGRAFEWALVGMGALPGYATAAGARVIDHWHVSGREFAVLENGARAGC